MSLSDISKLQGLAPKAPVTSRDAAQLNQAGGSPQQSAAGKSASPAVSVEIANPVSAGEPPVSSERVAEIRAALRDGSYPLVPAKIADAMIAARLSMGIES